MHVTRDTIEDVLLVAEVVIIAPLVVLAIALPFRRAKEPIALTIGLVHYGFELVSDHLHNHDTPT